MNITYTRTEAGEFKCSYGRASYIPTSFKTECEKTAEAVAKKANSCGRKPTILLSGGLDSEVLVKSFLGAGIDFDLVTFRYLEKLNGHELVYTEKFCAAHGLKTKYLDIDIVSWVRSKEAKDFFVQNKCYHFGMVPHMKLVCQVWEAGGYPIVGAQEVVLERINDAWCYVEYEHDMVWYRLAEARGIQGTVGFFQSRAELQLASLIDPRTVKLASGTDRAANFLLKTSREVKYNMYFDHWPDLVRRPKFHGAERVSTLFPKITKELSMFREGTYNGKITIPYAEFVQQLMPSISSGAQ